MTVILKIVRAYRDTDPCVCGNPIPVGHKFAWTSSAFGSRCMDCLTDLIRDGAQQRGPYVVVNITHTHENVHTTNV